MSIGCNTIKHTYNDPGVSYNDLLVPYNGELDNVKGMKLDYNPTGSFQETGKGAVVTDVKIDLGQDIQGGASTEVKDIKTDYQPQVDQDISVGKPITFSEVEMPGGSDQEC